MAALNINSKYRFEFINATKVTVTYTGNMLGDSNYANRLGETFTEWIGFGVRSAPLAKDDMYRVPTSGATTASVLANDTIGGATATTSNATVAATGAVPAGLTLNTNGTITIAANTAPGTYTIPYKVCSNPATTPESCAKATATVVVEGAIPANDAYGPIPSATGATTASVLANDKVNLGDGSGDVAAVLGTNGNATLTPGTSPVSGLTMNPDGTITVAANTAHGSYSYPYTLCAVPGTTPPACATATATVVVAPTPKAVNDTPPAVPSAGGGTTPSVLANDTMSGQPVVLTGAGTNATFTPGTAPTPTAGSIKMDPATGVVTVAPGTTPGTYSYPYTICSVPATNPASCSTATATIVVAPAPQAVNDTPPPVPSAAGGTTPSVLANDTVSGQPVVLAGTGANATFTPGTAPTPAAGSIKMDPATGVVTIAPGTTPGTYSYPYTICSVPATNPASCSTATATIVVAPTPQAVNDTPPPVPSAAGGTTPSVLTNDTVSGQPVVLTGAGTNATFTPGAAPTPTAGSITMDPATGVVTIAPGTTPGTYSYPYTLCAVPATTPPSCSTATATIVVAAVPLAVNDTLPVVMSDAGGSAPSVLKNDSVSGQPVVLTGAGANATLTPGTSPQEGIVMNPDGTVTVKAGTPLGTYTYPYKICSVPATDPPSCSEAIATVVVVNPAPVPVGPWWLLAPGVLALGLRRLRGRRQG